MDDIYEGQTLICIWSTISNYHAGGEYKVLEKHYHDERTFESNFMWVENDDHDGRDFYRLSNLNKSGFNEGYFVQFVPMEFLSPREQFIFKLSGALPTRYT